MGLREHPHPNKRKIYRRGHAGEGPTKYWERSKRVSKRTRYCAQDSALQAPNAEAKKLRKEAPVKEPTRKDRRL